MVEKSVLRDKMKDMQTTISRPEKKEAKMQTRHTQSTTVARPVAPTRSRGGQRPVEKPVEFTLPKPEAQAAAVAGTFNNWDLKRTPMMKDSNGNWKATV